MNSEITKQTAQSVEVRPVTPDARALNGVTHGMTAQHVPPEERESYAAHVLAVRASTGATTYLEQRLADRAALALWRLDRVARYEAAQASSSQRGARAQVKQGGTFGAVGHVTRAWAELVELLPGESVSNLKADPGRIERSAVEIEMQAALFDRLAGGGSAEELSVNDAWQLGEELARLLLRLEVKPAQMVRAMTGRAPKRSETASVEDGEWTYEPDEVPGLLDLAREQAAAFLPMVLRGLAVLRRKKAQQIREAHREALAAERDALALAAMPDAKALDRVTRYEAHLERGLYRALHELEAARREREGERTPPPLRGVLSDPEQLP